MLGWTDTETCGPKPLKTDGSLASLASDTGALSSAMHTSERHHVGMAAAMSPEALPPYSDTTVYSSPNCKCFSKQSISRWTLMPPSTLCLRTTLASGSCLDTTVLTGRLTGADAPCMVSWMVHADANCCLCCAEASLKDRCTSALCWPLRTGAQPATWACRAGCSYIAAMAWLTTLRLLCLAAAEVAGCKRLCTRMGVQPAAPSLRCRRHWLPLLRSSCGEQKLYHHTAPCQSLCNRLKLSSTK